jgi:hypothetical protein
MLPLVSEPGAITAAWLTEALRACGVLPHGRVREAHGRMIGTGKMGDNVRYELAYEGAPDGAPSSVVAKLPASDPTARASSAAQGSYWREVSFYREVAPRIPMRTPRAYAALVDDNKADYVILMEDMRPAEPGDQIAGCDAARAEIAVREAAKLHAPFHGDPWLETLPWVTQTTPENAQLGQMILGTLWPGFVERSGASMSAEGRALGERFVNAYAGFALADAGPRTLVHADYRLENALFGNERGGPPIAVVDWQSCLHACGLADVAYFVGGGLPAAERRAHERELVEAYRGEMAALGVALDRDACWREYRRYSLHGVLITVLGSMLSGQGERGDRMFHAMIERHLQHALDLDAGEFVP